MSHFIKAVRSEVNKHFFDYLMLFTAGVFFIISINIFRGERTNEFIVLLIFVSFYIVWGIYHHIIENTLHIKTVVEYILIGFILLFLLKMLLLPS